MNILINTFSFPSIKENVHDGRFVYSEAIGYAKNGAVIKVLTPHYPGADKTEQINENIEIIRFRYFFPSSLQVLKTPGIPLYGQKSLLAITQIPFLCLFFALNILRYAWWADIIHAQWTVSALLSLPAKWILGKKIVLTARGSDVRLVPRWLNAFIHSKVDAAIDCFGPQSWNAAYKKSFPSHYLRLPLLVHNDASGIVPEDMKKIYTDKSEALIILYVGRFDYLKIKHNKLPLINLIPVSRTLKERGMKFRVFYIGNGDEQIRKKMLTLIDHFDLQDYVTLLGVKTNVLDYIQFCDIGIGGIVFNAVSQEFTIMCKPQILVEGDDNRDTPWRHGVNCIFSRPEDQADLSEKLIWAMRHRKELTRIGNNANEQMRQYIVNSEQGGQLYLEEFQSLIKGPGCSGESILKL